MLLAGVAAGFVDGVIAATTPTGRAISMRPRTVEVAQQAHRLAPILGDLVAHIAKTRVAHCAVCKRPVVIRGDDRPAGRDDHFVDLLLRPAVDRTLRDAGTSDQFRYVCTRCVRQVVARGHALIRA
jgi:hypothetical protein